MSNTAANVVIQPGVPIPPSRRIGADGHGWAQVFRTMNVGDSFAIPFSKTGAGRFSATAKSVGAKAITRTTTENGTKVIRVWRIA